MRQVLPPTTSPSRSEPARSRPDPASGCSPLAPPCAEAAKFLRNIARTRLTPMEALALGRERPGVVGRNGCGKSTLLRLIAGEIEPASGSVQRASSIGVLAQLADDSMTVARALGVANDFARLRRLESGEGSLD